MAAHNPTTTVRVGNTVVEITPDRPLIVDGLDWTWAFVIYATPPEFPETLAGSDGSVWRKSPGGRHRKLGRRFDGHGYVMVNVRVLGKRLGPKVHRLVLSAFYGPRRPGMVCCHAPDPNRENCRLDNLRWDTPTGNSDDKLRMERQARGELCPQAKLTEGDVRTIRQLYRDGVSMSRLAKRYAVNFNAIWQVVKRKSWKHVTS